MIPKNKMRKRIKYAINVCNCYNFQQKEISLSHVLIRTNKKVLYFDMENLSVNELQYIALFAMSGTISKLLSIDCFNIHLFSISFSIDFAPWKIVGWFINFNKAIQVFVTHCKYFCHHVVFSTRSDYLLNDSLWTHIISV